MANLTGGVIAQGNTDFNLTQASEQVTLDVMNDPYIKLFRKFGIFNDASKKAAERGKGDLVKMPNVFRLNSKGDNPAISAYAQAKTMEFGQREIRLGEYKNTFEYERPETLSKQRDSFDILSKYDQEMMSQHERDRICLGIFQQLCGNTATSVEAPLIADTAFNTTAELLNLRLQTTTKAPTSQYFAYGSAAALANPAAITATNAPLTMQDLQLAKVAITRNYAGVNRWGRLKSNEAMAICFVSETGGFQLINQARAASADSTLSQTRYSLIEGGKKWEGLNSFYSADVNMIIVTVPDDIMSRAVHNGTENALSRCAVIVGGGALDFAIGSAFPGVDGPSYKLQVDDTTAPLDDKIFIGLRSILAGEKVQLNGFGANAGNLYDHATYVIAHSAAS